MSNLEAGLSVTFEIGGRTVPVQSANLDIPSGKELKDAIKEAIEKGLEFSMPLGQSVTISLAEFTSWLSSRGLTLPPGFDDVVSGTQITISSLTVSTKGKFDVALLVEFSEGILPQGLDSFIDVKEIGLRLKVEPAPPPA
ncbi:MAG: hypothetical protein P8129_16280 [Anaerolineae bacterium]|jgi:hypothetical protein